MERRKPLRADQEKQRAWQQRGAKKYAEKQRAAEIAALTAPRQPGPASALPGATIRRTAPTDQERTRRSVAQSRSRNRKPSRNDAPWRAEVMALHGEVCVACGDTRHVQADHLWPRSQGGPSHPLNGLPLCGEFSRNTPGGCHPQKTAGTMLIRFEWLLPDQIAWLAEVGWVAWDDDGQPHGRGWRHFAPRAGARREER